MANVDVSFLLQDPDFTDEAVLIKRTSTFNEFGEMQLTEQSFNIICVIQSVNQNSLARLPQLANLHSGISVWYAGDLQLEFSPNGYSDVILWRGKRYQVVDIPENFLNWGGGWTQATCKMEDASNV